MLVSGSFLSDKLKPKEAINIFDKSDADYLHVDIMDGKFVLNKTYTIGDVIKFSSYTSKMMDIHLMVKNPDKYIDELCMLNVNDIIFHYEAVKNQMDVINHIKNNGVKAGVAINPETSPKVLFDLLPFIDIVLVMTVEPGKSGQKFMESVLYKIDVLKKEIDEKGYKTLISVDGGVNETNIDLLKEKKVDILVSSSYLLSGDVNNKIFLMKH